jgi:Family of unknown function (DUF6232)
MAYCVHCGQVVIDEGTFCPNCGGKKSVSVSTSAGVATAVVAVQKTETEKTFLSTNGVTVTNTRVIVPGRTYAMAGITSVRSTVIPAKRGWAIATAIFGLLFLIGRAYGPGIFFLAVGIIWAISLKDKYAVSLSSASGEVHAVVSKDADYVSQIVQAVNDAIVYRS